MSRAEVLALAERVEAGEVAYKGLAKDIYRALFDAPALGHPNGYGWREDESGWWLATGEDSRTPPKTIYPPKWLTSLDAAMTLVPDGCNPVTILIDAIDANRDDNWLHALPRYVTAAALRALAERMTDD